MVLKLVCPAGRDLLSAQWVREQMGAQCGRDMSGDMGIVQPQAFLAPPCQDSGVLRLD